VEGGVFLVHGHEQVTLLEHADLEVAACATFLGASHLHDADTPAVVAGLLEHSLLAEAWPAKDDGSAAAASRALHDGAELSHVAPRAGHCGRTLYRERNALHYKAPENRYPRI
jgi:hypothetical protein